MQKMFILCLWSLNVVYAIHIFYVALVQELCKIHFFYKEDATGDTTA